MVSNLNGWRRLWVVLSALMLLVSILGVVVVWPERENGIVKNIASATCKQWLELPAGFFPEEAPDWRSECHSLTSFLYYKRTNLSSASDYDKYIFTARFKVVFAALGIWLGAVFALFAAGWSVAWVVAGFRAKRA